MASIGSIVSSSNRIKVKSNLGGRLVDILIDTGAACSCTDIPLPLTGETIQIKGIGETIMTAILTKPVRIDLGAAVLTEPLWYLPGNSEGTVLGMDIMEKHGFIIHCLEKQIEILTDKTAKKKSVRNCASIMPITNTDPVQQLMIKHSDAWANHEHDCGLIDFEVSVEGNPPPPQKQYKIKPEAETAAVEIVKELEARGIVRQCSSAANSPCLPVPKVSGKWRFGIDYQRLNQVLPKHPEPLCVFTDSRYVFGTVHDYMAQWQLRKFLTSAGTPIKHFSTITSIWQEIQACQNSMSVIKVRAHIHRNPDVHEQNNNIVDQLAKQAAIHGTDLTLKMSDTPAISTIPTTPIDIKQYQKDLWVTDEELTPQLTQDKLIEIKDGTILRENKYVVHASLHKPVIKLYHDYAHVSADKTLQLIKQQFWWPAMAEDVDSWCASCLVCAAHNQGKPGRTKLCRPNAPKGPWEALQMDFIGPFPSAKGGYRYCLVVIDKFSKWGDVIPTRNNSARTVARVLANQIIPLFGAPLQIESDQGSHFTGLPINFPQPHNVVPTQKHATLQNWLYYSDLPTVEPWTRS